MPQDLIKLLNIQIPGSNSNSPRLNEVESLSRLKAVQSFAQSANQSFAPQYKVDQDKQIESVVSSILTSDLSLDKAEQSVEGQSFLKQAGDLAFGDLTAKMVDADAATKKNINSAASIFKKTLTEGTIEESQKALGELRDKYNKIANSTLSFADKESLRKSYSDMVEQVNGINRSKRASKNFDAHLSENTLQDREKFLSTFDATNKRLSFALKSKQTKNEDIINQLADLESNRVGSRLYNPEDLAAYKASYFSTDQDLNAGMEMQYNYAIKNAADDKIYDYEKQIFDIDNKIKDTYSQEQKNLLAIQKTSLNQELSYAKKLSEKLKPLTVEDTYLKSFYPEEYSRKKAKQKQEVFRNERLAEGDQGSWAETLGRNVGYYRSNVAKQLSGIHSLLDDPSEAYRLKSKADYITPPTFFVGKDLNKNNKIDDSEITRDIHDNKVTFSQVSWTDKKGNTTWNFWSPAEQILPISMDVLNTVFLSKGIGLGARATKVLSWSNLAGAAGLTEASTATFLKSVAPRISTMGAVTVTTFPRFYAEERSNFKDGSTAFKVASLRAIVEGLTESITPDVKLFDGGVAYGALDNIFARLGKLDPASISRLTTRRDLLMGLLPKNSLSGFNAALLMAPTATRRLLSGATQEAFEEVAALVGNYFVDKYSTQQNFEVEETNKLNWGSALDTFVEGFIPSLFISGATNLTSRNAMRQERLSQARWNIANNPEQYKQLVANEVSNQKITKDEGLKKTAAIDNIARRLDSMTEINHIKSLTNLLDDKELQFAHFNNHLFQEDLLNVDTTQLSPEQLQEYEDLLANTSKSILTTSKLADKYVGLDETDKKAIISKLFETQANAATNADTNLSALLRIAEQTRQSLLSVPVNDARYAFVSDEYKKFQDKVDVSIQERLGSFNQTLENNPENLTNLELQLAAHTFYPAVNRMNAIDAQYTLENSPLIQPTEYGPNAPELIQNILDELSVRETLNEGEFQTEITRNLQNPETKSLQEKLLAIAELSAEELQSGELEKDVHDHLTASQKFELAQKLELHKIVKEQTPETLTFLEEQKNQITQNNYSKSVAGLDVDNTRAKIIEMNKTAMEARLNTPVVNNFAPTASTTAPVPVPPPTPVENIPGVTPDIDQVIFDQYSQILSDLIEIASNQDIDPEENKIQISKLIKFALRNLDNLTSLNQVRSALLGLFPDNAAEIESVLEKANNGVADASGFTFLVGKRKAFVEGVISKLVSQGQLTVDITVVDPFIDVAPETPTDEDIISADNFDSAQDTQNQEVKDVEYTGKGLRLNMVSLSKEDIAIDDFPVTLSYNILDACSSDTRSGKAVDLNVRIQSMMGIYEFALSPEAVEGLKELQSKTSLTNEEKDLLVGYFTVNGQLIHDAGLIDYVKQHPSAIGTGVGTTFVDSNGNLLKFTSVGKPSTNKKAFLSVGVLAKNKKDVELTQVRTLAENGQVITSPVVGIASGVSIVLPLSNTVNEKIYVHTSVITLEEVGVGKSYFVRPGSVQLVNENARNKYTGVIIPTNGNSIQALVNAFNEGTLPKELDESIRINATEFLNYISRQINSTYIKVDPSKSKLAIRYFKKANLYLSSTNDNKIVVKSKPNKNLQKTQNQNADLLKLGESSYKLVDARLLEENKPFTALVVTGETVSAKQFNTYTDYVKSPEFGATIKREENRKLIFSLDYKVTEPTVDVANDNVEVIDVVENIPTQITDAENALDPTLVAARNGDVEAQKKFEKYGLEWQQTTTYRFVGQSEVDVLLANERIESKRGMANNGIDVTSSPKVTTGASNEFRVTFKEVFDKNNGLGLVRKKNEEDSNLQKGRGYDINDVAKIERIDENGNIVETIYEQPTDAKKADIERRRQEELDIDKRLLELKNIIPKTFFENVETDGQLEDRLIFIKEQLGKENPKAAELANKILIAKKYPNQINATYDAELARELYKEIKAGKLVTDMTVAEQAVANKYITKELRKSVDAELAALDQPVQVTEPIVETPKPLRGRDLLNNMNTGEAPEFFRSRVLSNKVNSKQKLAAKNWVANHPIFKNTTFIFDNTINHPEAYASWSKAGIFLYKGANYAEAYHESWHEFSQFYLTPEQKESLYAQARVIYGELSFVELEERLAEDFRAYALSNGKTLPENIKKNKDAKSIFTKIWDFLTNLFTDKKTVDHYFSKLYKGNISQFKRNEANAYFKTLYSGKFTYYDQDGKPNSLSFKDSKALLDDVDSLYAFIANNVFKKQGQSFVNIITTPINANSVYPYIKQYLATQYDELLDEYNKNNDANLVPQINVIVDMHDRFASVAQYHKQNSSLFDDKIRKELVNTQIEELEKTNLEFATYEASVNDFSQKQLASQVLINSLKTLSKYENGVEVLHPILGIPLVGNFSTNWNILQRKLSGSNSYADLYSRVEELTETYPQFKQFLEYLPPSNTPIKLMSTMNFKNEFNRIFSMPYIEGYTTEIKRNEEGQISDVRVFQAQSLDTQNIRKSYDTQFALNLSPYSLVNTELGTFYLNTDKYFTNFPGVPPVPKDEEDYKEHNQALYNMLKPLGFNLSENSIEMFVNENPSVQNERVTLIYNKLKSLATTQKYITTPLASLSSEHTIEVEGKVKSLGGETTSVSSIIQYEVDANPQYVNDMRYNAANKQIWSVNQHTFMTKVISVLNDGKLYPTLDNVYTEMPHLNPKNNPNTQGSFILEYLFKANGERYKNIGLGEKTFKQVSLANLLGIKDRGEGEKTIDTSEAQKHFADIMGLVKSGIEEINRLSGKSTTRGLVLDVQLRNFLGFTSASNQSDPFNVSGNTEVPEDLFEKRILPLINAEVAVTVKGSANFTINSLDEDGSPKLAYFHKIFTPKQRQSLFSAYKTADNSKSLKDVFKSIPQSKEIFNTFQAYIAKQVRYSEKVLGDEYPVSNTDLFKYHFFSFVSRIEQHKVFFGHPYYYKNAKDIEKRLSMWNAYGSYPTLDAQNLDFLNSSQSGLTMQSQREAYQAYANKEGIKVNPNRANIDQISYIVLADEPVNSATAKASKYYGKNKEAYINNKKAATQDSAAFCTLDFYRKFYSTSTGITFEMNQEFKRQDNIYKKYLELQTAEEYQVATITKELEAELNKGPFYKFTIKKLQYAGHNVIETGESVPVGHKYTVKPILPSELMGSSELAAILGKLHASSADYAVYASGSKLSETIKPVKLLNSKGEVNGKAVNTGVIDLKNLKEQVLFENKEDFNTIFSTQFRKLIYKDVRTEEGMELYNAYKGIIESLTGFDKLKFLEQLDNKEKLVEMLIREMSKKNVSETTKDLIKLKEDGTLMHSLDSMIDRTIMESAIVSSVKSAIIRQKVPGAQRIQYPVSLLRPGRKLKYYDIVDGKITKAETIVSFSKGYYPLLNLVSPVDKQPIGELDAQGNPINPYTALTRLNEALNNPKFRDTYANQLTIVAIRVPGQAHNSMENLEIVEFLPEESGEIILVADEMVVKSGSDFDGDKLFCYDATIKRNGTFSALLKTPKESIAIKNELLDKLKENKELFREILDEKKALTQELGDILTKKGFDPTTKVADLYKELQSYKHADENELAASGVITEADLLKLKERLEKGISAEENPDAQRIKTRISKLRSALGEIYDADLSNELGEINKELKELSDKTNEIKDQLNTLRGEYSNALILNISQRLSQPEIFNDLITPNDIRSINDAVSKFGKQVDISTASLTNIVSPLYQLYVFSLNTYIAALGIDAKNNVFQSLLQKTTFYREDKEGTRNYLLDANRTSEGYINFSELDNVDGQSISYIPSELISAHVDIGKNDGIAQINLNDVATPIVNYVNMAGSRFEDIVQLINMTRAIISYTKGKDLTVILDKIKDETPVGNITLDLLKKSKDKYGNYSRYYLKDVVFKNLFAKLTKDTASTMLLTEEGPLGELRRFVQFLELEDQSRDLANVSRATDYDTFSPQNFESFRSRIIDLVPYLKETGDKSKIFNKKGLQDIISNTVISSFEVQQEVLDKFIEVFPVSANSALTNKILIEFAKLKENNKKLDYDKFSRTFKNDLLYTLFINNVPEAQNFETYVDKTNPGNISAMSINLKSRLKSRGIEADNIMFDIMTVTSDVKLKLTPQILSKYLRVGVLDTDLDYSIDMYKEAFEQGFNWSNPALDPSNEADADLIGDMQGFFKAFAYAGIIGSQLNKKFDSFLPLIPESIYTLPMTDVLNKFSSEFDSMIETYGKSGFLTDFVKRFKENHPEFRKGATQPVALIYYKDYVLSRPNSVDMNEANINELTLTTQPSTSPINIYSTDNNGFKNLSNVLNGPVKATVNGVEKTFKTVEHLYQIKKALFAGDKETANKIFNAATGFDAQKLSKTIKNLDSAAWDKISSKELESAMRLAFKQNQSAKDLLLSTGTANLTHKTKFNLGKWETVFPEILMKIRKESQPTQPSTSVGSMTLKEYADKTSARFIEVRQVLRKDDIEYFNDRVNDLIADRLKYAIFASEDLNNKQYLPFINKLKENGFEPVKGMEYVLSKGGVNPKEEYAKLTTQPSTSTQNNDTLFGIDLQNRGQLEFHVNTLNVVAQFLENIGVEQRLVSEFLSQEGSVVEGAMAAANFIEGTVDIIDDLSKRPEAWNKLPEEAAHFWYRLLETNSPLKKALWESHGVALKNNKLYQTEYGRLVSKPEDLTEESIGQLIAEAIKRIENKNANTADYSFFKKFLEWINSVIDIFKNTIIDPFEVAAMKILSSDMSDLMTWAEYSKLNNIVNFADVLTEQSVAPVDYTLINDIGYVILSAPTYVEDIVIKYGFVFRSSETGYKVSAGYRQKYGESSPKFSTQQELDNWVSANVPEHNQRQKAIIQEVRDNEQFFDRLLNKSFRKRSKFLPKTLRKYFQIRNTENLDILREWDVSRQIGQITKKLSEEEKEQIIQTNGYTNIAPTLKVLPDLLQKYKKNPIVLSESIKLDTAKKQELSILDGIRKMIKSDNPTLKSLTAEEFVQQVHEWLEFHYLLGFANETSYLSYRVDQTFTNVRDRSSDEDFLLANMTEEEIQVLPFAERQRIATVLGLTKQNPDVYHNKVSLRFNDMYHLKSGHFSMSPSAWGNLTYFYTGKNKWKDGVLLHEIQNDNIEFLKEYKTQKVDLETSLGNYLQNLNAKLLDNITQIESSSSSILVDDLKYRTFDTYQRLNELLRNAATQPLELGMNGVKEKLNEFIELYKSDDSEYTRPEKAQKIVDENYAKKRKFAEFKKRGGIRSLLNNEELVELKNLLSDLNVELQIFNIDTPVHAYNFKEKKAEFKRKTIDLTKKINSMFSDLYGEDAPLITLSAPAKRLSKNERFLRGINEQKLNESVDSLLAFSEIQMDKYLSKDIWMAKRIYNIARNSTNVYNFNVSLLKITPSQYIKLIENFNYNEELLARLVEEQAQKDLISSKFQEEGKAFSILQYLNLTVNGNLGDYNFHWSGEQTPGNKVVVRRSSNPRQNSYESFNWSPEKFLDYVKEFAPEYLDIDTKFLMFEKQKNNFTALKQNALDKKEELEKEYGKIEDEVKQTLDVELNYFTPLVHHLIQKHINQYGKDFPMYFSGFEITKLTQNNDRTALIYAGKDEVNIVDKNEFTFNQVIFKQYQGERTLLSGEYDISVEYLDKNTKGLYHNDLLIGKVSKSNNGLILEKDGIITQTNETQISTIIRKIKVDNVGIVSAKYEKFEGSIRTLISKQEYEKAYQQATERRAKEIKFEAILDIGILNSSEEGIDSEKSIKKLSDKELEVAIKKLNEYKKESKQNLDRVVNTIMNISGSKPIETGAIYNAMSQIGGIKLVWENKVKGLKGEPGGYKVDLSNYNYNTPVLYGLQTPQARAREVVGIELTPQEAQDSINAYDKYQKELSSYKNTQVTSDQIISEQDMYDLETGKILMESFAKLRELNNTLSKNC